MCCQYFDAKKVHSKKDVHGKFKPRNFFGVGKQTVANLTNLSQLQNLCGDIFSPLHKICLCVNMFNSPAEVHQTP